MVFALDRDSHTPLYSQIVAQVREMIRSGALKMGDRLPANRELAETLGVNRTTVSTAYAELAADGLISSQVGRGTFVSAMPDTRAAETRARAGKSAASPRLPMPWDALLADQSRDPWLSGMLNYRQSLAAISLAYSLPPAELFPLEDFRRSVDRVFRKEGGALLQLGTTSGYPPLQEYLVSQMRLLGIKAEANEVLITNGCQQSLDLIRQVLVGAGDEVALENPTYPGALSVFCGASSRYVTVPVRERGLDLDVLEDILSQRRPKLIYTIPSFHNP
ncbi:MAG TPA: PLP-dependent aminotransferase family protein, partial [Blastocatellia bacterium]|nr:PLP-dependent aminotransferase family protein [Blastocatellia bacterium]